MTDRTQADLLRLQGLAGKLEANHEDVTKMMRLMVKDNLGAMSYGQYGGSFPNPTQNAVIARDESPNLWARDNNAENDLADYLDDIRTALAVLEHADFLRRKYMSANMDMWNRMDPTDFCRPHWFLMHRDDGIQKLIPRRVTGDLCKDCNQFREMNGRPPEPLELERFIDTGKWPHKLYDPKERRAV